MLSYSFMELLVWLGIVSAKENGLLILGYFFQNDLYKTTKRKVFIV